MTTATFEALNDDGSIGIIRVYEIIPPESRAGYKFFTVAKIIDNVAYIHGLSRNGGTWADFAAGAKLLGEMGVKQMQWVHNDVKQTYNIRQRV